MLDRPALEGTNQVRRNPIKLVGSFTTYLASGGAGRRRNCLRRDRDIAYNNATNVRGNAKDR